MDSCATVVALPGCSEMGSSSARVMLTELSHALPTVHAKLMVPKSCMTLSPTGWPKALSGVQPHEEVALMKLGDVLLAVSTSLQSGTAACRRAGGCAGKSAKGRRYGQSRKERDGVTALPPWSTHALDCSDQSGGRP